MNLDLSSFKSLEYDSRKLQANSVFVAIKGEKADGHDYIAAALEAGAGLIIYEKGSFQPSQEELKQAKFIEVTDSREALGKYSAEFFGMPSQHLNIIGITGTNGKTTVAHIIQEILEKKSKTAMLGTMGLRLNSQEAYKDLGHTTPQAKELQAEIKNLVDTGFKHLTMEVSSHALDQKRVYGLQFKQAIITNLTQDHLDYHISMDNYFKAKALIFKQTSKLAILNADDAYYKRFKEAAQDLLIKTYAIENSADYQANNVEFSSSGLSYDLKFEGKQVAYIKLALHSMFNVYNSLAAICSLHQEGFSFEEIQANLAQLKPVPGRFEVVAQEPLCIVDYAHSPDGLLNVLKGARQLVDSGNLICLFGCGGDRDITKRPKMAKIAFEHSDFVYVTSDNPRSEDPEQIIADILAGIPDLSKTKVIADRRQAIQEAVKSAKPNDVLVIAGKGHEDYQILNSGTIHFDDREETLAALDLVSG